MAAGSARAAGHDHYGDDLLVAFPDEEFLGELRGSCRMLLDNREMILEWFRSDYVNR